ncbi:MAG TPA: SDR family NAD(P)-dependent oxidoreductase [Steroidobacter sp.]|jgi:NAD(P)-dependent dehydrogenase (short-subunit alcohol dehydrogenase family)|nr:SDR family NAD(P)-dependent oxidoreductase [Steroidobacteraceae bacterium]HLS81229.1 SDR family NAD(P)-dependent oxidoreductase [Steroidobacter sp.]
MSDFQISPELLGLIDQVALVTGGATGVGRGSALQLARAGCHVAIADINEEAGERTVQEIRALGRKALFLRADVRRQDEVRAMVTHVCAELDGLDVAVNNVGNPLAFASVLDFTEEQWDAVFALDLKTTLFCSQAAAVSMIERGVKGRIVNVGSTSGVVGAPSIAAYGAAKAGVIHLTKTLALELAPYGIRVNCLVPGAHATEQIQATLDSDGPMAGFLRASAAATPLQRLGGVFETGGAAVFLASNLSSYMTGQAVISDGGISLTVNRPPVSAIRPKALAHLEGGK